MANRCCRWYLYSKPWLRHLASPLTPSERACRVTLPLGGGEYVPMISGGITAWGRDFYCSLI
jgi:hypothetical protein